MVIKCLKNQYKIHKIRQDKRHLCGGKPCGQKTDLKTRFVSSKTLFTPTMYVQWEQLISHVPLCADRKSAFSLSLTHTRVRNIYTKHKSVFPARPKSPPQCFSAEKFNAAHHTTRQSIFLQVRSPSICSERKHTHEEIANRAAVISKASSIYPASRESLEAISQLAA